MQKIKAVFFDIDGTTYQHNIHDIPESTRYTLSELKKNGYFIGFITGRSKREIEHTSSFLRNFPYDAFVFDGGAQICLGDQEIVTPINQEDMKKLCEYCERETLYLRYSTKDKTYFHFETCQEVKDIYFNLYLAIPQVKPYENEDVYLVHVFTCADEIKEELSTIGKNVNYLDLTNVIEITQKGVSKEIALEKICDISGFNISETMCFGDGPNDIGMISHAGIGVAMGNGDDKLKQCADIVCKDIHMDGIYETCLKLNLIKEMEREHETK